ncbi:hypothetical protein ABE869_17470 [Enterococcus gilvus]|uniref:hypothetical protein n=1 Tax=Enterococcus gilvus TaxID=160453 RepID=UPI003D6C21E6
MDINLDDLDLMSFPEASVRWRKERTYVTQQYAKYPHKFLEGSTAAIGMGTKKTFIITREGMEYLMKQSEIEANQGSWLVKRHWNRTIVTFDQTVHSESEAQELIIRLIHSELGDPSFKVTFDKYQKNPIKCRVILKEGTMFTYEMVK